ncbi:MAG: flagellar basal body protein [Firmicutes bacterium]|jgi:flagellar basal-body rod protein FlgB|nr:flagellar basal body protein [Bacillota bacterium]MDH7495404.1 flagellar basal body protein [Bacillota bacterium]
MPVLGDQTIVALSKVLDALSLRHEVTADNIANVNTPGFKARRVLFEDQLKAAISRGDPGSWQPTIEEDHLSVRRDGNSVDIDLEMACLAETTMMYSAMSRLVSDRFSLLKYVISEGRR